MKPDKVTMSLLLDQYGALLTQKQRDCFDLYCNQDLTLAEIAELMGTSRQGVHDAVTRAEAQLLRYEEVTHSLAAQRRTAEIAAALERIAEALPAEHGDAVRKAAADLRQVES
jgi:Uncharacterized protein conserved in bacteria